MKPSIAKLSEYLQAISSQPRLEILLTMGTGEACVCHLEAKLGYRQAYISQHLMALREAGVIVARREGRFVYYSLLDPQLLELIRLAAGLSGVTGADLAGGPADPPHACACPKCSGVPVISLAEISTLSQA